MRKWFPHDKWVLERAGSANEGESTSEEEVKTAPAEESDFREEDNTHTSLVGRSVEVVQVTKPTRLT